MGRGELTNDAQLIAKEKLGRTLTLIELRLMPYVQYVIMNEQQLNPNKINSEERKILSLWRKEGHIEGGVSGLVITKEFWDAINEILWETYVKR